MNPHINYLICLAVEHLQEKRLVDAERVLRQAIKMMPKNIEVLRLIGVCSAYKKNFQEALKQFDTVIKYDPNNWLVHSNRGNALAALGKTENAIKSYEKSISLNPNYAEAYNNKANVLRDLKRYDLALKNYDIAITLDPYYLEAYGNIGRTLLDLNLSELALTAFEKGFELGLDAKKHQDAIFYCKMKLCIWDGLELAYKEMINSAEAEESIVHPFTLMPFVDDPFLIQKITRDYIVGRYPSNPILGDEDLFFEKGDRIHIAYFSADFKSHAVSFLIASMIELHDRSKFKISGFSTNLGLSDNMTDRLKNGFDEFYDVSQMSDKEIATLARELNIEIAVDLGGLTQDARPGIFAIRAAPIQISYIGYLGTMAAPYMDYIVADEIIIPAELQDAYSEKIVYLPSYQINDPLKMASDRIFNREELGLPAEGFVYCCFNNNYKLTPSIFNSWAKILKEVDGSVLLLYAETDVVKKNLCREIELRGINSSRLIFGGRLSREDYLARYRVADLFLDTSPYNAGTTASDALWVGLPVLTFIGKSFSARMGASILHAIGLSELVASSQAEYEALAIELGTNKHKMDIIKDRLLANRLTTPLFNAGQFTQTLELAFIEMYERHHSGLPQENIN